jgi:hypothetical protein
MGHEISQFDIQDRQLLAGNPRPRAGIVTNLGEAKITRTIFGRAKVRVVQPGRDGSFSKKCKMSPRLSR